MNLAHRSRYLTMIGCLAFVVLAGCAEYRAENPALTQYPGIQSQIENFYDANATEDDWVCDTPQMNTIDKSPGGQPVGDAGPDGGHLLLPVQHLRPGRAATSARASTPASSPSTRGRAASSAWSRCAARSGEQADEAQPSIAIGEVNDQGSRGRCGAAVEWRRPSDGGALPRRGLGRLRRCRRRAAAVAAVAGNAMMAPGAATASTGTRTT